MTARRYTQAQVDRIFAAAKTAADLREPEDAGAWYAYALGHVSAALGADIRRAER